jgi:hypothetical protein
VLLTFIFFPAWIERFFGFYVINELRLYDWQKKRDVRLFNEDHRLEREYLILAKRAGLSIE